MSRSHYNYEELLELAQNLESDPNTPGPARASLLTAVNRAYYACYRIACEFMHNEPSLSPDEIREMTRPPSSHRKVINYFRYSADPVRSSIGDRLHRLVDWRVTVDYYNVPGNLNRLASDAILEAEDIIQRLHRLHTP